MSDVMMFSIARMPYDMAMDDEISRRQFHANAQRLAAEHNALLARVEAAPVAIMDTRDALSICAPTEADFPALYAIQGKRVRLVVDDVARQPAEAGPT